MHPSTAPEPLRQLRFQLDQCRAISKRAVFPDPLKQQAVAFLGDYSVGTVIRALGISPTSLSRWKNQLETTQHDDHARVKERPHFVALPNVAEPTQGNPQGKFQVSIVLKHSASDQQVTLQADVTMGQWQDIIKAVTAAVVL